jgi:hypothetical protein
MLALALDALAEQERQVAEVRSRASALLAAGAVVASLLADAIVHGRGSHIVTAAVFLAVGIVAAGTLLGFSLALLWPKEVAFSLNATETYQWLFAQELTDEVAMNFALADNLQDLRTNNANDVVDTLTSYLRRAVISLAVETVGLAIAAWVLS